MELISSLVVLFLVFYLPYRLIKAIVRKNPGSRKPSPQVSRNSGGVYGTLTNSGRREALSSPARPKRALAKWFGPGQTIKFRDYVIPGLIYAGEYLPDIHGYQNDASLLNPKLKIIPAQPWEGSDEMGYWPSYEDISPKCRGAYLKWLSTGRSEPETYIGYVFLFFYGLERRLLLDGQRVGISDDERIAIIEEVRRLIKIYGKNNSFNWYAHSLLASEWVLYQRSTQVPDYLGENNRYMQDAFRVLLARYVAQGLPLPPEIARQWLALHPEFNLRTSARRCANEYGALFAQRYTAKFGEGIVVPPNKKKLSFSYHAASASLRGLTFDMEDLPDRFLLVGPIKKVQSIAEQCTDDLDAYSRFIGRKGNDAGSLAALSLLPPELLSQAPNASEIRNNVEYVLRVGGLIETKQLYKVLGEDSPASISKKEAESLAALLEKFGYGLIPDCRYYGMRPDLTSKIVLFAKGHGKDFTPSEDFHLVGSILRLGAMVAQADGQVSEKERNLLQSLITDNRNLSGIERDSLTAYLLWCLNTVPGVSGLKKRLESVGEREREILARILVSVAQADGHIDPGEVKQLEKLYTTLGLAKTKVAGDLHAAAVDAPVTVRVKDGIEDHGIPKPPDASPDAALSLNAELIRIREQETAEVRAVLENIFKDPQEEAAVLPASSSTEQASGALDPSYRAFFEHVVQKEYWERPALYEVAQSLGLMLDGALEVLNEWAFDAVNAPLIEDGDPVFVDLELAAELSPS